jgi:hypothetical protein
MVQYEEQKLSYFVRLDYSAVVEAKKVVLVSYGRIAEHESMSVRRLSFAHDLR